MSLGSAFGHVGSESGSVDASVVVSAAVVDSVDASVVVSAAVVVASVVASVVVSAAVVVASVVAFVVSATVVVASVVVVAAVVVDSDLELHPQSSTPVTRPAARIVEIVFYMSKSSLFLPRAIIALKKNLS